LLDADEFEAWFRLLETPGLGRESARRLLAAFGSARQVLQASAAARQQVVGATLAQAFDTESEELPDRLRAAQDWLSGGESRRALCIGDDDYPAVLLQTPDPPLLLYVQGQVEFLHRRSLAIVGSRNASPQGVDNARAFAAHLSRQGWTIVSGLAFGIDGAHTEAVAAHTQPTVFLRTGAGGVGRAVETAFSRQQFHIAQGATLEAEDPMIAAGIAGHGFEDGIDGATARFVQRHRAAALAHLPGRIARLDGNDQIPAIVEERVGNLPLAPNHRGAGKGLITHFDPDSV